MSHPESSGPVPAGESTQTGLVRTLGAIVEQAHIAAAVQKSDLACGDQVIVRTRNSVYSLWTLGDGAFAVSGGWFDKQQLSPALVGINGCTYGGSVIRHDVVAAPGLFLEFGNGVSTTRIVEVRLIRHGRAAPLPC